VTDADRFDPERIVETLNRHRVDYVLIGGYAARLYGARRPTYDIDIAPSTAPDNLHRLSEALRGCLKTVRFGRVAWSWS
jgi:hypothetical protein